MRKCCGRTSRKDTVYPGPGIGAGISGKGLLPGAKPPVIIQFPEVVRLYWGEWLLVDNINFDVFFMELYLESLVNYLNGNYPLLLKATPVIRQYGVMGASLGQVYVDSTVPAAAIGPNELLAEIHALQAEGDLPAFSDSRIFLIVSRGISWGDFNANFDPAGGIGCGIHGVLLGGGQNAYVAVAPFPSDVEGCQPAGSDPIANWQVTVSHEIFEAATDPQPFKGWYYFYDGGFEEGADVCSWFGKPLPMVGQVQDFFGNPGGCSLWQGKPQVLTPTINGTATGTGTWGTGTGGTLISESQFIVDLQCNTPGATIFYTLDGTVPSASSKVYTGEFILDVPVTATVTITALALLADYLPSSAAVLEVSNP